MAEPWKPTGEKLPTGEIPKESMAVAPEVARQREAAFAAKRAEVLGQDETLREAARTGDVATIERWAPGDDAVNKPGQGGWTALHFAAREGGVVVRSGRKGSRLIPGVNPAHHSPRLSGVLCACAVRAGADGTAREGRRSDEAHEKGRAAAALRCGEGAR